MGVLDQIRPGDVIAVADDTAIALLIRLFSGGPASHVAIAVDDASMAEALMRGLQYNPLTDLAARTDVWIRRLPGEPAMDPVVARARYYTDQNLPYATHQLILLAAIAVGRNVIQGNRLVRTAANVALLQAARLVDSLVALGRDPMICSEFAHRCYNEASPDSDDEYTIRIDAVGLKQALAGSALLSPDNSMASRLMDASPPVRMTTVMGIAADDGAVSPEDPETILREAEEELAPLAHALAGDRADADVVSALPAGLETAATDAELMGNAADYIAALGGSRVTGLIDDVSVAGIGPRDVWRQVVDKAAGFVTPNDLLYTDSLETVATFTGADVR